MRFTTCRRELTPASSSPTPGRGRRRPNPSRLARDHRAPRAFRDRGSVAEQVEAHINPAVRCQTTDCRRTAYALASRQRLGLALAADLDRLRIDTATLDQVIADRAGPAQRQIEVVLFGADAVGMSGGFLLALFSLGAVREILGSGTIFQGAALMLGDALGFLEQTPIPDYRGFLLVILPPGGFIALGFVLAGKRAQSRPKENTVHDEHEPEEGAKKQEHMPTGQAEWLFGSYSGHQLPP